MFLISLFLSALSIPPDCRTAGFFLFSPQQRQEYLPALLLCQFLLPDSGNFFQVSRSRFSRGNHRLFFLPERRFLSLSSWITYQFTHRTERPTVQRTRPFYPQAFHVSFCAVAFMLRKAVSGIISIYFNSPTVARYLGAYRCAGK